MILSFLLPIALKSLVIAAAVLMLLKVAGRRSPADRSLIAHLGLLALLALPLAAQLLPTLDVAGPEFLAPPVEAESMTVAESSAVAPPDAIMTSSFDEPVLSAPAIDWTILIYGIPALIMLALTLVALLRLVLLKHRATVMVEAGWLSALAQAQRRMGFKHGTALLSSDDLPSPISWGVVRPVILLNRDAAGSSAEAEAVIAHELAHVANFDWAKLLFARLCIALFWFNPLVWLLAREAHQLREEAADDAVLAANIEDTDYAQLLVGVARHECRGLLIGAHGVAPSKNSLARRVRRVLDTALNRAPGGWRWTSAAAFFAAGVAVPLAALTVVPATAGSLSPAATVGLAQSAANAPATVVSTTAAAAEPQASPRDLPGGAATVAPAIAATPAPTVSTDGPPMMIANRDGTAILRGPNGATFVARADGTSSVIVDGRAIAVASADGSSFAMSDGRGRRSAAIDRAVSMKAVGVSPDYARSLAAVGYPNLKSNELIKARALGIDANYIRSIASAGYRRLSIDRLVELKALNVTSADISRYRRAKGSQPDIAEIIELKALGVDPSDIEPEPDDDDPGG